MVFYYVFGFVCIVDVIVELGGFVILVYILVWFLGIWVFVGEV